MSEHLCKDLSCVHDSTGKVVYISSHGVIELPQPYDAAPDMLAALERIVAISGSTGGAKVLVAEFKEIARAAIAKARRES